MILDDFFFFLIKVWGLRVNTKLPNLKPILNLSIFNIRKIFPLYIFKVKFLNDFGIIELLLNTIDSCLNNESKVLIKKIFLKIALWNDFIAKKLI